MIAAAFGALARVRRAPAFHPRGVVLTGHLDLDGPGPAARIRARAHRGSREGARRQPPGQPTTTARPA